MPTNVFKIDSNYTGLAIATETSPGVLGGSPVWYGYEPNSYSAFGGEVTKKARNTINPSRQNPKGVTVDRDANFGFPMDVSTKNLNQLFPGLMFAAFREKNLLNSGWTAVATSDDSYARASGASVYLANDLIFAENFTNSANNGLKVVASSTSTKVLVTANLVDETPPASAALRRVGFQFATGDLVVNMSGALPELRTTTKDMTQLGLLPGEWIFIGGDTTTLRFADAANINGFARIRSVTANVMVLDKTNTTPVADVGTGKTVQIFFGSSIKNEQPPNIVRTTFQSERSLGAPDTAAPSTIQAQYCVFSVLNEAKFNFAQADLVTVDLGFVSTQTTEQGSQKSGTRVAADTTEALNTTSDISRLRLALVSASSSAPTPLFAYIENFDFAINNNISPAKAVAVLGAFDMTTGSFGVSGSLTGYFTDTVAITAVTNNSDATFDVHLVKDNRGLSFDMPLVTLSDGRPTVEKDASVKVPMNLEAASGEKVAAALNYTLLATVWSYLPALADI